MAKIDSGIGRGGICGFIIHPCVSEISLGNSLPATEVRSTSSQLKAVIMPPGLKEEKKKMSCFALGLAFEMNLNSAGVCIFENF